MELIVHSLRALLVCGSIHTTLQYLTNELANSLTCCTFQLYFVTMSFSHLYSEYFELASFKDIRTSTLLILYQAIGYFLYDLLYLYKKRESQWQLYSAHHIAGLIMLFVMIQQGLKEVWYHNMVCFISEIINPSLNLRSALAKWYGRDSSIYQLNKKLIVVKYTIFRIILFPIVAYKIAPFIHDTWAFTTIYILTTGLYLTSVMWYRKLLSNLR
jgi:hypothetical protein